LSASQLVEDRIFLCGVLLLDALEVHVDEGEADLEVLPREQEPDAGIPCEVSGGDDLDLMAFA
jgi:hypothetical protein